MRKKSHTKLVTSTNFKYLAAEVVVDLTPAVTVGIPLSVSDGF